MLKPTNEDLYFQTLRKMQKQQKTLFMTLKKQWFDMILSGEKKEEYRELKDYWGQRLCYKVQVPFGGYLSKWTQLREGNYECLNDDFIPNFEKFDVIRFKNGYGPNDPVMDVECLGIEIRDGRPDWGAVPGTKYFVLKLGNILKQPG